ncbi:MAG: hypothetical protein D5R98_09090 [Desulfonatronovibrio sp. MSAO_Bac4]|nr:MAG: hypothetical protein D5R98_09090 [Desulfonatronovibrio sp. MSAO_Bac4]
MKKQISYLIISLLLTYSGTAFAQGMNNGYSTDITSDKMTYTGQDNTILFSGNVHVQRPDFELWSKELHVFLKSDENGGAQSDQQDNIDKIIAKRDVRIKSDGREGRSEVLTYHPDTGIARLEGNPMLIEDKNSVEGEIIILNMLNNTSEVLGGPEKRVRVIFQSEKEQE